MALMTTLAFTASAQDLKCQNQNSLEAQIDAIEAQGWVESGRSFTAVNYLIEPEAPYLIGTLQVGFYPDCDPNEPCPRIAQIAVFEAYQQNDQVCLWRPANLNN